MAVRKCDLGVISNKKQVYHMQVLPVAAGQILEAGMVVTCNGPVRAAGRGAKWYTVGVIESGGNRVTVFGSGAATCVRAGMEIGADQVGLKAWDRGTVAPMEEDDRPELLVARVRGPSGVEETRETIPAGGHVSVVME